MTTRAELVNDSTEFVPLNLYDLGYEEGDWNKFCREESIIEEFNYFPEHELRKLRILLCHMREEKKFDRTFQATCAVYKYCVVVSSVWKIQVGAREHKNWAESRNSRKHYQQVFCDDKSLTNQTIPTYKYFGACLYVQVRQQVDYFIEKFVDKFSFNDTEKKELLIICTDNEVYDNAGCYNTSVAHFEKKCIAPEASYVM